VACGCQLGGRQVFRVVRHAMGWVGVPLCMGWAATLCDVAGWGGLFCVGGSVVAGRLELSG
jgi:hypothetical protein